MRQSRKGMWALIFGSVILLLSGMIAVWPQKFDGQNWISALLLISALLIVSVGTSLLLRLDVGPKESVSTQKGKHENT